MVRTNCHGLKDIRAIEVRLYVAVDVVGVKTKWASVKLLKALSTSLTVLLMVVSSGTSVALPLLLSILSLLIQSG